MAFIDLFFCHSSSWGDVWGGIQTINDAGRPAALFFLALRLAPLQGITPGLLLTMAMMRILNPHLLSPKSLSHQQLLTLPIQCLDFQPAIFKHI